MVSMTPDPAKSSSWKSTEIISKGDSLADLEASARGAGHS